MAGSARRTGHLFSRAMAFTGSPKPCDWDAQPGAFWVYAIQSEVDGAIYVGQTNDLAGRVRQHNDPTTNRSRYTKRHPGAWRLVHAERVASRAAAMARERFLKSGRGRGWLRELLNGGASPPPAD
jgi:putative endonuclease